jgi:hypothetical protein
MDDFEIITSPNEKWRRLALLLDSEMKDKINEERDTIYTQYYTFHYDSQFIAYEDYHTFDDELDQIKTWFENAADLFYKNVIETF